MKITIRNVLGIKDAELSTGSWGILQLTGKNGSGKSSLLRALGAALTMNPNPLGLVATNTGAYRHAGSKAGYCEVETPTGSVKWELPRSITSDGAKPWASEWAVGMVHPGLYRKPKERTDLWSQAINLDMSREDIENSLSVIEFLPYAQMQSIVDEIYEDGWDSAAGAQRERGRRLKSQWEDAVATTGQKVNYGVKVAMNWRPPDWLDEYRDVPLSEAMQQAAEAQMALDSLQQLKTMDEVEAKKLEEARAEYAHCEATLKQVRAEYNEQAKRVAKAKAEYRRFGEKHAEDHDVWAERKHRHENYIPEGDEWYAKKMRMMQERQSLRKKVEVHGVRVEDRHNALIERKQKLNVNCQKIDNLIEPEIDELPDGVVKCPACDTLLDVMHIGNCPNELVRHKREPSDEVKAYRSDLAVLQAMEGTLHTEVVEAETNHQVAKEVFQQFKNELSALQERIDLHEAEEAQVASEPAPADPGEEPDDEAVVEARKDMDVEVSRLSAIQSAIDVTQGSMNTYKKIIDEYGERVVISQAEIAEREREWKTLDLRYKAIKTYETTSKLHSGIQASERIIAMLGPKGIRSTLRKKAMNPFLVKLEMLNEVAGWGVTEVDPESLEITYEGRDIALCSRSEQWRADLVLRASMATIDGSDVILADDIELLDDKNLKGLMRCIVDGMTAKLGMSIIFAGTIFPQLIEGSNIAKADEGVLEMIDAAS